VKDEYMNMNEFFGFPGHGREHRHHDHPHHHHPHHFAGGRRGGFGGRGGPWGGGGRGGGPAEWFGDFFGPPPRADRGGVRYLVLDAIAERARHGYEVISAIEERSGGTYRPSPGVVYPTLQMLEELGHARVVEEESRKVYAITDEGRRDLAEHRDEVDDFYDRSAEHDWERQLESFRDLKRQAAGLFRSFKRAARRGRFTPEVQTKVVAVLHEALERIEAILRESDRER
jgi:DNA-binding PadR family transcriptional regulator